VQLKDDGRIRTIVLDIEGTTTPVEFVYRVLFPYARTRVQQFIERHQHAAEVRADIARLRTEHAAELQGQQRPPPWRAGSADDEMASVVAYVQWLMDCDRKSTALKSLQGKIWEAGYRSGELRGQVFADVPPALARWRRQGKDICIFSSGSVQAQQLLFANSTAGDLTRFIRGYFDTTSGPKTEAQAYQRIAAALERSPSETLFLSDVIAELDAAQRGGMRTALCVRSREAPAATGAHPIFHAFDEIFPGESDGSREAG
jgi:enolase-phosphatase E1